MKMLRFCTFLLLTTSIFRKKSWKRCSLALLCRQFRFCQKLSNFLLNRKLSKCCKFDSKEKIVVLFMEKKSWKWCNFAHFLLLTTLICRKKFPKPWTINMSLEKTKKFMIQKLTKEVCHLDPTLITTFKLGHLYK